MFSTRSKTNSLHVTSQRRRLVHSLKNDYYNSIKLYKGVVILVVHKREFILSFMFETAGVTTIATAIFVTKCPVTNIR